ncbi:hypothetical protein J25TS5_25300 [Paenibacillus faecis]|uniref:hypothetical protein n=1 Tax=Paenibacillus faecis TaxID=862114 RepID=UPI001AFF2589|nr:hypothetical protein [Paenibacillus faecis]GIO85598.1 hypothetical protein J25TS5_25300 [Paenibacillus faecis]
MQLKRQRHIIFVLTLLYTLFILYFLFFAFGRAGKADQITEYTFMFVPVGFFRLPSLSDLFLNHGIPDHKDSQGSVKVTVDGQEVLSTSAEAGRHEQDMASVYIEQANELTITIEGDETVWDVGYRDMAYTWK